MPNKETQNANTLSQAQIDEWKAEYGHVYKTADGKDTIIYRPIRRSEYRKLMIDTDITAEEALDTEKRIERLENRQTELCNLTVLYPDNIIELLEERAGLALNLSDEIMGHSGFNNLKESEEL